MRHATQKLVFSMALAALIAVPMRTFAAPTTGPMTVRREGFETSLASDVRISAYPSASVWWGRTTAVARTGGYSLWCAGSNPSAWPTYPSGSAGDMLIDLPQLSGYYSAGLSFSYSMPSVGAADASSFIVGWRRTGTESSGLDVYYPFPLTAAGTWSTRNYDMAASSQARLSRSPGSVLFRWHDFVEGPLQRPITARGPAVDDVVVTGYRYGPVRSLAASEASSGVVVSWARPLRAVGATATEERAITYRLWRRPALSYVWSELTAAGRVAAVGDDAVYVDDTASPLSAYMYIVQAWDSGSGSGYGVPRQVAYGTQPVAVRVSFGTPAFASTPRAWRAVSVAGAVSPARVTGVVVQCWQQVGTTWVLRRSVPARVASGRYSAAVTLGRGYWRVRAYHAAEPAFLAGSSAFRYVTVR